MPVSKSISTVCPPVAITRLTIGPFSSGASTLRTTISPRFTSLYKKLLWSTSQSVSTNVGYIELPETETSRKKNTNTSVTTASIFTTSRRTVKSSYPFGSCSSFASRWFSRSASSSTVRRFAGAVFGALEDSDVTSRFPTRRGALSSCRRGLSTAAASAAPSSPSALPSGFSSFSFSNFRISSRSKSISSLNPISASPFYHPPRTVRSSRSLRCAALSGRSQRPGADIHFHFAKKHYTQNCAIKKEQIHKLPRFSCAAGIFFFAADVLPCFFAVTRI